MKKLISLMLVLCLLLSLASLGSLAYAEEEPVGSEMWLLRLLAATALDDSDAMVTLGRAYFRGEGVEQDLSAALKWFQKAADAGNTAALIPLGDMYQKGEGVEKNLHKAYELFTAALNAGEAEAQSRLDDPEMKAIASEAVGGEMWLLRLLAATALDDSDAMATLGYAYYRGEGVEQDLDTALKWFRKAADAGNTEVLSTLSELTGQDEGTEKAQLPDNPGPEANAPAEAAKPEESAVEKPAVPADMVYLSGHWGEYTWIRGSENNPFYLDTLVSNAAWVEMTLMAVSYQGAPFGEWYLYAMGESNNWDHIAQFTLNESMMKGPVTLRLTLDQPSSFKALALIAVEKGTAFTLWRFADFYVDPEAVPEEAAGAAPESLETQFVAWGDREPPLTRQIVGDSVPGDSTDYPVYSAEPAYNPSSDYKPSTASLAPSSTDYMPSLSDSPSYVLPSGDSPTYMPYVPSFSDTPSYVLPSSDSPAYTSYAPSFSTSPSYVLPSSDSPTYTSYIPTTDLEVQSK